MTDFKWNRELTKKLITAYRMHENLYNTKHPDYCCQLKRLRSLQQILKVLQTIKPEVCVDDIKRKIRTIRNQFTKELRAEHETNVNGVRGDDVYEPMLWCYRRLGFLRPFCKTKSSASSGENKLPTMNRSQSLSFWTKEQTYMLIEQLKKHPLMYDQSHPLHPFRANRVEALRKIAAELKIIKPEMTPKLIVNKIRLLKSQYHKEKKMIQASIDNPKPGEPRYTPKLWCFHLLSFLDKKPTHDSSTSGTSESSKQDTEEVFNDIDLTACLTDRSHDNNFSPFEDSQLETADQPEETDKDENNQVRNELHSKCLKLVERLACEIKTMKPDKTDNSIGRMHQSPHTFLGLLVESELSKVTEDIYEDAKWKIIRILEEASKRNREAKLRPVQINLPSTSGATPTSNPCYNIGGETRITILDNHTFRAPIQTPIRSKQKIMEISKSIQNK